ncbi:ABC transporter permease [Deinococcus aquiradiocola]|uniref:Peptide ABC transporter permease n=1 Tax=Deinococcus aquiradiocola TaxID=393059 RepID=A0A917UMY4_9DEIO|nr:ABC transporter permease [Deinococcus aquiradiocola]GGJ69159.1 peptide ABC transporter permease [Deinococcus aquiradiocola]
MTVLASPARPARRPSKVLRRFLRHRAGMTGLVVCAFVVIVAVLAPWSAPHDPDFQFPEGLTMEGAPLAPGGPYLLGTDLLGRDLLSRLVWGARASLTVGFVANGVAVVIGLLFGALGALTRGWAGTLIMRFTDVMLAFPVLLLAIALTAILRPSLWIVALVIAFLNWVPIARVVYSEVSALREREFVEAATAVGASGGRILLRHIVPHLVPTALVWGSLGVGTTVLLEATLSFLGVGVQPPTPSWGGIINESQSYLTTAPWLVLAPGAAILITSLGFNLLGEGLRDALDPRSTS